jgi:3-dehydroquinate dehydratase
MSEHKSQAEDIVDYLADSRDNDPIVLAAMAQTHAMLALIETIESVYKRE